MTIITSTNQLIVMPLQGICQGGQPIISYNYGAKNNDRVKKAFFTQFKVCVIFTMYKLGNYDACHHSCLPAYLQVIKYLSKLYSMGIENIYGRNICNGIPGKLSAEFYGVGTGKSQSYYWHVLRKAYIA